MNVTITLDGRPFAVTDRASDALRLGIDRVCAAQPAAMKSVVTQDVEQRLAQYFQATLSTGHVITAKDVRSAFVSTGFGSAAGPESEVDDEDFNTTAPSGGSSAGGNTNGGSSGGAQGFGAGSQGSANYNGSAGGAGQQPSSSRPPFRRAPDSALMGGVCAGLANWIGIDVVFVRLFFVVVFFLLAQFWLLPTYLLMWIIVPVAPGGGAQSASGFSSAIFGGNAQNGGGNNGGCLKIGLIVLVCLLFFFGIIAVIMLWPIALSLVGQLMLNGA